MNIQEFIKKSSIVHNNKYDYSLITSLPNMVDEITIICPIHGKFNHKPKYHLYHKRGCRECSYARVSNALKYSLSEYIEKAKLVHNNKYDYSLVEYNGSHSKIQIICPIHGLYPPQAADSHLQGHGCPKCDTIRKKNSILSLDEVLFRFKSIHGDTYDYSLVNYTGCDDIISIICFDHGPFDSSYTLHYLMGSGCKYCNGGSLLDLNTVITRFKSIHGSKYDYSKFEYIKADKNSIIICPIHGEFFKNYTDHYHGRGGCPKCANNYSPSTDEFINSLKSIHLNKYDYSLVDYNDAKTEVNIICPIHGIFPQTPNNHKHNKTGCPRCTTHHISKAQEELFNFTQNLAPNAILEDRTTYPGLRLDITIPDKNLAIEYNGVYWHAINHENNSRYGQRDHLKDKMLKAQELGLRVINIYEDEWQNSRSHIEQIIKNALGVIDTKIMARKCKIWSILTDDPRWNTHIKLFFEKFHHQGLKYKPDGVAYCIIRKEDIEKLLDDTAKKLVGDQTNLVSEIRSKLNWERLITPELIQACAYFGSNSYHNQNDCELIRYATKADVKVVGGLSKLVKNFLLVNPQVKKIKTYCDARLFTGDGYRKAGFRFVEHSTPGFDVISGSNNNLVRKHRSCIIKSKLSSYFDEETLKSKTQMELAADLRWYVVPDCGQIVFEYFSN